MESANTFKNKPLITTMLLCGIAVTSAFWVMANAISIYKYAVIGALFEIAWLPMIGLTFAIPVASFLYWYRDGWKLKSWFLYIGIASTLLIVVNFLQ